MRLRDRRDCVEYFPGALLVDEREIKLRAPRVFRFLVFTAEFSGKQSTRERTPNQQPRFFRLEQRHDLAFQIPTRNRVISLQRIEPRIVPEFGDAERFGDLPRLPIRTTDVAHLALAHEDVQRLQRLFKRRQRVVRMNLIEIDVVSLQATQTTLDGVENVPARRTNGVAALSGTSRNLG